ncbi:hypothetical protein [Undibacterium sp.]|uniref:hypothetical protein n=1 Tax=Undibacterium sp. TaxID=1914977 RepID=UPI003752BE02
MADVNKIKYARFLIGWDYQSGNKRFLEEEAARIPPNEYSKNMKGSIFCPECSAPVFRSPENKEYDSNGRKAFYAHNRGVKTDCSLRVFRSEGKRYENEEAARRAIENEELVIVQSFMKDKPEAPRNSEPSVYDREPNEDSEGGTSLVSIGRHTGEEFQLPSIVTSIRGLCRNFDQKLNKYMIFPGERSARTLQQMLINIEDVSEVSDKNRLYYGRITHSRNMGKTPKNIRQTFLSYTSGTFKDFCIKATDEASKDHGIDDNAEGRIVVVYGKVTESGIGLCIANIGWGEFALLPPMYEWLLDD